MPAARKKTSAKKSTKPTRKKAKTAKPKTVASKKSRKTAKKKPIARKSAKASAAKPAPRAKLAPFEVGATLPDFVLEATSGANFRLSGAKGRKLVLYFYPKDATPGCTIEGNDFSRLHGEFQKAGADVYGVSRDSLKSHENFKAKQGFPFELLSDPDETLCRLFDVIKEKNLYGRKFMGIERSTFVIDAEGRLAAQWRGVKVPGHAEAVLETVRALG